MCVVGQVEVQGVAQAGVLVVELPRQAGVAAAHDRGARSSRSINAPKRIG